MKKRLTLLLSLTLALTLTACGGGEKAADPTPTPAVTGGETASAGFTYKGTPICPGQNMADILSAIGEPQSYFEAESCAFQGLDKTYTYPGFVITTQPEEAGDIINSILLTDDSVTTGKGVYIGASADEVTAAYGPSASDVATALIYEAEGCTLTFILGDGAVTSIEYLLEVQ